MIERGHKKYYFDLLWGDLLVSCLLHHLSLVVILLLCVPLLIVVISLLRLLGLDVLLGFICCGHVFIFSSGRQSFWLVFCFFFSICYACSFGDSFLSLVLLLSTCFCFFAFFFFFLFKPQPSSSSSSCSQSGVVWVDVLLGSFGRGFLNFALIWPCLVHRRFRARKMAHLLFRLVLKAPNSCAK